MPSTSPTPKNRLGATLVGLVVATIALMAGLAAAGHDPIKLISQVLVEETAGSSTPSTSSTPATAAPRFTAPSRSPQPSRPPHVPESFEYAITPDAACREALAQPGAVLLIGDSLSVGGARDLERALTEKGFPTCVDARGGRNAEEGNVVLRRFLDSGMLRDDALVVMEFGANDTDKSPGWGTCQATTTLSRIGHHRLLWVNGFNEYDSTFAEGMSRFNGEIDAVAARIPQLRVVDWHQLAGSDTAILRPDRIHPSKAGIPRWVALLEEGITATDTWSPEVTPVEPVCSDVTTTLTPASGPEPQEAADGQIVDESGVPVRSAH